MLRRLLAPFVASLLVPLVATAVAAPVAAQEREAEAPAVQQQAKAWVLADADSGAILAALNHREPLYVASLVKVMTAFVTLEQLQIMNDIEVSELAADQQPMRIGMEAGQVWELEHALHALLMVSANDAAYAMAEAAAGGLQQFAELAQRTAERLGMKDSQWLDPAGFDGEEGFGGGTKTSAQDLAIIARNALEVPEIAAIVAKPTYEFVGGDGEPHTLRNHNKMLATFPGLTGMKTGYTRAAGHSLIATAERDGRRLIAVVIGATGLHYDVAAALLNQGFNTPADSKGIGTILPPTSFTRAEPPPVAEEPAEAVQTAASGGLLSSLRAPAMLLFVTLMGAFFARREQIKRRKRRRMAMRRAYLDAKRRGMIDVIDAERYYGANAKKARHVHMMRPEEDIWPPREMQPPNRPARRQRESAPSSW